MEYAVIVIMCLMLVIFEQLNIDEKYQNLVRYGFIALLVLVTLIGGFRFEVGFDFKPYTIFFRRVPTISADLISYINRTRFEIGFISIASLLKTLGLTNVASLFTFVIVFCVLINHASIKRYTPVVYFSLFMYIALYFFGREMGQIRQALATAITFYSFRFIKEKKPYHYFVSILIASSFHYSMLILFPFYFLGQLKLKSWHYIGLLLMGILFTFFSWLRPFNDLLVQWNLGRLPYLGTQYGNPVRLLSIQYARRLFPAILAIISMNKLNGKFPYYRLALNMVVFGAFLSLLFNEAAVYVERLFVSFIFCEILIFGYVTQYPTQKHWQSITKIALIAYAFVFLLNLFVTKSDTFFPYQNQLYFWLSK